MRFRCGKGTVCGFNREREGARSLSEKVVARIEYKGAFFMHVAQIQSPLNKYLENTKNKNKMLIQKCK